jgi:RNA polymerase sigma-70 factor (ECF subfamily)
MNYHQTIVQYQPMLHAIAYNLVRCKEDAEDIVQETFLKWLSVMDKESIQNTKAYLIKSVTNNCINHLNSLKRKKEECMENVTDVIHWIKETNLAHLDLDINLKAALAVLTAKLEPLERAVYLLKEIFDLDYEELQHALDKKKDHCRQLLCRAKKKLSDETSKISLPDGAALLKSFKNACDFGNASELISALKKDISSAIAKNF